MNGTILNTTLACVAFLSFTACASTAPTVPPTTPVEVTTGGIDAADIKSELLGGNTIKAMDTSKQGTSSASVLKTTTVISSGSSLK